MGVRPGFFKAEDILNPETTYGGGVIMRPTQVAAILNSTHVNARNAAFALPDAQFDPFEGVNYGPYVAVPSAGVNKMEPYRFKYVQQDAYKGLIPWEILPEIPEGKPWE